MPDRSRLVSSTRAAAELGVDPTTVWRWYKSGRVRPALITPGGHLRWDMPDLRRQLAEPAAPERPAPPPWEVPPVHESPDAPQKPAIATAIVVSDRGVLVGKRNDGSPPWTFIAGQAHDGEPIADAAVREVKEETGLVVIAGSSLIGRRIHPKTGRDMHYVACRPTEGTDVFVGDEEELAEVRWVPTIAELLTLMDRRFLFEPVLEHLERLLPAE